MTRLEQALRYIAQDLRELGYAWALVGGLAVSVRAEPRFTRDMDLALSVEDDSRSEALCNALLRRGYHILAVIEQEAVGRLATVRLLPPGEEEGGLVIDLLFASSGIEPEVVSAAEPVELMPGLSVPVAKAGHLIALKVLSRGPDRPQDQADLKALIPRSDDEEKDRAREAVALISDRGFHRGKDLRGELHALLS